MRKGKPTIPFFIYREEQGGWNWGKGKNKVRKFWGWKVQKQKLK